MTKRYFRVDTGRYGGEVVVGTVSKDFVEYWKERDSDDMVLHIFDVEWDDRENADPESPPMTQDGNVSWHEVDDLEHVSGPYSDSGFCVQEIELLPGVEVIYGELVWSDDQQHDYAEPTYVEIGPTYVEIGEAQHYDNYMSYVYGREAYNDTMVEEGDEIVPVLQFHSSEKGNFGTLYVQTDGSDFDPNKLSVGVVETDVAEIIENYWYDGIHLEVDYNESDTVGKGSYASVGYFNKRHHDDISLFAPDGDYVKDLINDLYVE